MKNSTNGWQRYSLEELSETIDYGLTASAVHREDGPRFLRITDIQDNTVNWASVPSCNASRNELVQCQLQAGDIVFARTGATTGKSFLIRTCPNEAVFASYLIRVRPGNRINPVYLSHYFNTPEYWAQIQKEAQGAGQPGVNSTKLKTLSIPLPPLPEQRRIADILDKADAIRRKRQEAVVTLKSLVEGMFLSEFGDPLLNPQGWPLVPLGKMVSPTRTITYGILKPGDHVPDGIPMLRIQDVDSGKINTNSLHRVSNELSHQYRRTILDGTELVISLVGTIGLVAMVPDSLKGANVHRNLGVIVPNTQVRRTYLHALMNLPRFAAILRSSIKGGNQALLNLGALDELELPLPPLDLQERFEQQLNVITDLSEKASRGCDDAEDLFSSLVQRAFRGEL